jgi:hypothetical protein
MQCEYVGSVAWFVHECMERVDNSHNGLVEDNNVNKEHLLYLYEDTEDKRCTLLTCP